MPNIAAAVNTNLNPQPVSAALQNHFDQELAKIRTGKSGQVNLTVTTSGAGAGIGVRKGNWEVAGWGGREWSTGWLAGGTVGFHF